MSPNRYWMSPDGPVIKGITFIQALEITSMTIDGCDFLIETTLFDAPAEELELYGLDNLTMRCPAWEMNRAKDTEINCTPIIPNCPVDLGLSIGPRLSNYLGHIQTPLEIRKFCAQSLSRRLVIRPLNRFNSTFNRLREFLEGVIPGHRECPESCLCTNNVF